MATEVGTSESFSFVFVKDFPPEWRELWEQVYTLARKLQIPTRAVLEVFRMIYDCTMKEEEGRPKSTGIIVAPQAEKICSEMKSAGIILDAAEGEGQRKFIEGLFGLVDGLSAAFVLDKAAVLRGIVCLQSDDAKPSLARTLIPHKYSGYWKAMKIDENAFALLSLGNLKTVKFFGGGRLLAEVIYLRSKSSWSYRDYAAIGKKLEQLSSEKNVDCETLFTAFTTGIEMSNMRKGGTIVIGDGENVLKHSEKPRMYMTTNIKDFDSDSEGFLFNLATREFSLAVDSGGGIRGISVRFVAKLPPGMKIDVSSTDGGRHRSAGEISAVTNSIPVVVSDDGPITVFAGGKKMLARI